MKTEPIQAVADSISAIVISVALAVVVIIVLALLAVFVIKVLKLRRLIRQPYVFLELTPPSQSMKSQRSTQELFAVIHGLHAARSLSEKLWAKKLAVSLEVVSSKKEGIRYIVRVPKIDAKTLQQNILAYLPDVKVKETSDYLLNQSGVIEFGQTGHYAFPLHLQEELEQHDPIAYITGAMTKLEEDEQIVFQIVTSPTKLRGAEQISDKILVNEDLLAYLSKRSVRGSPNIAKAINKILFALVDEISDIMRPTSSYNTSRSSNQRDPLTSQRQQVALKLKPARVLSSFEQQLVESIHHKVSQPLFTANIRVAVTMNHTEDQKGRLKGFRASLASFATPKYQSLQARRSFPRSLTSRYRQFAFSHRLPSLFDKNANILAASEVADLYHFPFAGTTNTENIVKSLSRTLPAPLSLKNGSQLDILFGENHYHGSTTPIGLTDRERERHVYIIGGTGNGKTTMIQYSMVQDIRAGKGVAILDPHGDLAETLLRYIPEERIDDVIYMNPDDLMYPVGINLLELPKGISGDELLREKDLVTESTISVMRKIFSEDDSGGHRIEYVLRNTIQTALTTEGATLFTIFRLLNDQKYRRTIVKQLEDEDLKNFWNNELGKAGEFQRVKMAAGITAKIGRFLFSASAKRILEQEKSTIDFDDILDSGRILICNFSKGLLGEDTSTLFGTTVLAKLQMASLRRARLNQADRKPFYLYVDEFQNFATMSFVQMLSEARKYKLFLTMAEQSTAQQDQQRLVDIILANVGTVICFRSGSPADERLTLPLFSPYIEQGEIANLPAYNFYMRIAAINAQEPLSGMTVLLDGSGDNLVAQHVINRSRKLYAKRIEDRQADSKQSLESKTNTMEEPVETKPQSRSRHKRPVRVATK